MNGKVVDGLATSPSSPQPRSPISRVRAHVYTHEIRQIGGGLKGEGRIEGDCIWVALHCWLSRSWKIGWAKL